MTESSGSLWRPGASPDVLRERARLLQQIRAFFVNRDVLEVETPILSRGANTDPALETMRIEGRAKAAYLHTSPEFAMKRLLAAGMGDIYQICKVFRGEESGRFHNPEFTMLEWYRLGMDHFGLIEEVIALIFAVCEGRVDVPEIRRISYRAIFEQTMGIDPLLIDVPRLEACAREHGIQLVGELERDGWLDLLLSHCVMPTLPENQLTVLMDYPASQAALARLNVDGLTAARFEVFWGGLELANGFHELTDEPEQRIRFQTDNDLRQKRGLRQLPIDNCLLGAMSAGLPDCAGVAMGLDRLFMKVLGRETLGEVLSFCSQRA